jgi:hypothetical protein
VVAARRIPIIFVLLKAALYPARSVMSSSFRSAAGITAKSTALVTRRHGGAIEELMRSV